MSKNTQEFLTDFAISLAITLCIIGLAVFLIGCTTTVKDGDKTKQLHIELDEHVIDILEEERQRKKEKTIELPLQFTKTKELLEDK